MSSIAFRACSGSDVTMSLTEVMRMKPRGSRGRRRLWILRDARVLELPAPTPCETHLHRRDDHRLQPVFVTGNEVSVDFVDYLDYLADDPATGLAICYVEDCASVRGSSLPRRRVRIPAHLSGTTQPTMLPSRGLSRPSISEAGAIRSDAVLLLARSVWTLASVNAAATRSRIRRWLSVPDCDCRWVHVLGSVSRSIKPCLTKSVSHGA